MAGENTDPIDSFPPGASYGQAAILLVESLMHGLIERSIISVKDAIDIGETAADVNAEMQDHFLELAETTGPSLQILNSIVSSLRRDLTQQEISGLTVSPVLHRLDEGLDFVEVPDELVARFERLPMQPMLLALAPQEWALWGQCLKSLMSLQLKLAKLALAVGSHEQHEVETALREMEYTTVVVGASLNRFMIAMMRSMLNRADQAGSA